MRRAAPPPASAGILPAGDAGETGAGAGTRTGSETGTGADATAGAGSGTTAGPPSLPDDRTLTERGLPPVRGGGGRVLVIGCGALAREILDLRARHGWNHIDLACLPAILHNHPDRIPAAVEATIRRERANYETLFVAYADCGTGGALAALCARLGVEMIDAPHCYAFFQGQATFAARGGDEPGTFYLTDFLVRQFDAFVWKPLGLDRHPELRDAYFGHYRRLVYLAQSDDPALTRRARDCARRLGLAFGRRLTGYGDLETALARHAGATMRPDAAAAETAESAKREEAAERRARKRP